LILSVIITLAMLIAALIAPIQSYSDSEEGVPAQLRELNMNVLDISSQLEGISVAIGQLNSAAVKGTPIQLRLRGLFQPGDINLYESSLGPISFTVPNNKSMLIDFVTCEATRGVEETSSFHIRLEAEFSFEGISSGFAPLVQFVPEALWESPGPFGDRAVASTAIHAYLNIPSPAEGAPTIGDYLLLRAQRNVTTGTGGVDCTISGFLFDRPAE
jgi:hypothetical protein